MPKPIHRHDVLGWLCGIGIVLVSAGCSITSVGIDTPDGKAFAVETRRLPKSATDDSAPMNLRIPGASIWDCSGDAGGRVLWETEVGANCRSMSVAEGKVLVGTLNRARLARMRWSRSIWPRTRMPIGKVWDAVLWGWSDGVVLQ